MRACWLLILVMGCRGPGPEPYVPRGEGLEPGARAGYREALRHEYRGEKREALEMLDKLCAEYPLRLGLHFRRLRLKRELDGPEAASALYRPPPPGVDEFRGEVLASLALLAEDDLQQRRSLLSFAAEREPDSPYWRIALAEVHVAAHDVVVGRARNERELGRIRESDALQSEALGLLDRARTEAEVAVGLDAGFAEAELLLGYIETRYADLEARLEERDARRKKAEGHYMRALELDPESLPALLNLAENQLYFDRYGEAARTLEKAAGIAPAEPLVWNNLGYAYYAAGRLPEARACYQEALRVGDGDPRVRAALGDVLQQMGDLELALAEFERARGECGDDPALRAQVTFKIAAIHEHEERYREAIREYRRYIELGGRDTAKAESRIRHIYRGAYE